MFFQFEIWSFCKTKLKCFVFQPFFFLVRPLKETWLWHSVFLFSVLSTFKDLHGWKNAFWLIFCFLYLSQTWLYHCYLLYPTSRNICAQCFLGFFFTFTNHAYNVFCLHALRRHCYDKGSVGYTLGWADLNIYECISKFYFRINYLKFLKISPAFLWSVLSQKSIKRRFLEYVFLFISAHGLASVQN